MQTQAKYGTAGEPEEAVLVRTCPLCRCKATNYLRAAHTEVLKCLNHSCELRFAYPQLDEGELAGAYRQFYYPENDRNVVTYASTDQEIFAQLFAEAQTRLGELSGKSLLDFGCGLGGICKAAQKCGLRTVGIESDDGARTVAGRCGLEVYSSLDHLFETNKQMQFDFITMLEVVEHLRLPWKVLERLSSLFRPGGSLLLTTPNAKSLRARLEGRHWENIVNPTHLFYFTRTSLRFLLVRSGFSDVAEWRFPIRFPQHSTVRRIAHRALVVSGLQGQLVFRARPLAAATELCSS
jgi:SAM-dependent methyltransferase